MFKVNEQVLQKTHEDRFVFTIVWNFKTIESVKESKSNVHLVSLLWKFYLLADCQTHVTFKQEYLFLSFSVVSMIMYNPWRFYILSIKLQPNNKPSFQNAKMQVTWAYSKHHNKKTTKFITVTFRSSSVLCTLSHYNSLIKYLITFPELFYFNIRMISWSTQAKYWIIIIRFRKCILWHKNIFHLRKRYTVLSLR